MKCQEVKVIRQVKREYPANILLAARRKKEIYKTGEFSFDYWYVL